MMDGGNVLWICIFTSTWEIEAKQKDTISYHTNQTTTYPESG